MSTTLRKKYDSGFQIFFPIPNLRHQEIIFPDSQQINYSPFLRRLVTLKSHNLEQVSQENNWNFSTLNFTRLLTGLQMKELNLIEMSVQAAENNDKNRAFEYISLIISEDIQDHNKLQGNFSFYRSLCNWALKVFNQHILDYKNHEISKREPLLHRLQTSLYIVEESSNDEKGPLKPLYTEIAFLSKYQKNFKEVKIHVRKEDSNLKREQKSRYDHVIYKTTFRPSIYSKSQALELLLKGKFSSMFCMLKDKGFTIEEIQNNLKNIMFYHMQQSHFGLDYISYVFEDLGINAKQAIYEYFQNSLRRDIRKRIKRFFKDKGITQLTDEITTNFLKVNEILGPTDNITIAVRRKISAKPAFKAIMPVNTKKTEYQSYWDAGKKDQIGTIENTVQDYRSQLGPYNFGTFEVDDSYPDDVTYIERYYSLTKIVTENKEPEGPFKLEDFKKYERQIMENNSRISKDLGKIGRFKPKSYEKNKKKCIQSMNKLFSKYFGREIDFGSIFIRRINFFKLSAYFQIRVSMIKSIEIETMLRLILSKLELTMDDHIAAMEILTDDEKVKYLDFIIKWSSDCLDFGNTIGIIRWAFGNQRELFDRYFNFNQGIAKTPDRLKRGFGLLKNEVFKYLAVNSIYMEEEINNLLVFISRLSRIRKISDKSPKEGIVLDKLADFIKYLLDKNFLFVPLHLFKKTQLGLGSYLEKFKINQITQRALLQSTEGENHMGEILEKLKFQAPPKSRWESLICEMKYKGLMPEASSRQIQETDEFMLNTLTTVYQGFKRGNLVSDFLSRPLLPHLSEHLYDLALNKHRHLKPIDNLRGEVHYGPEIRQGLTVHSILMGMPFTAFLYFRYNRSYSILAELDSSRIPTDIKSIREVLSKPIKSEKDEGMKLYDVITSVYKLILKRPFDRDMIASLEAFLQLNELDPLFFLVDVIVYRRVFIMIYEEQNPDIIRPEELVKLQLAAEHSTSIFPNQLDILKKSKIPEDVYELFLEIFSQNLLVTLNLPRPATSGFGSTLIDALEFLEKATVLCENRLKNNPKQIDSPWRLVSKFCMLHNIPSSLKLLNEISAKNDWVRLLLELDVQRCPIETAKDFITKYFHQAILKNHLLCSLDEVDENLESPLEKEALKKYTEAIEFKVSEELFKEIKLMPLNNNTDLIKLVLKVREVFKKNLDRLEITNEEQLRLKKFLALKFIEISVFKHNPIFCQFAIFLDSSLCDHAFFNHLRIELEKDRDEVKKKKKETEPSEETEIELEEEEQEILEESKLIESWCRHKISRLTQIIHIYYGDVALLAFLDGLDEAVKNNFKNMNKCFESFAARLNQEIETSSYKISNPEFIEQVIDKLFKDRFVTQNQMGKILESLYHNKVSQKYQNLFINYCALNKTKQHMILNRRLGHLLDAQEMIFDPFKIYYLMLDNQMFTEAKNFGAHYGLENSYTLFIQANNILTEALSKEVIFKNHKDLFYDVLNLLKEGDTHIYQTSQYLKYLSSHLKLSLWDQIYLLNMVHDLINELIFAKAADPPLKKLKKAKKNLELKMDVLLYSHYPDHIRTHLFTHKEMRREVLISELSTVTPIPNVSLSESLTTLVRKAYLNGLTNFDFPFIKLLESFYIDLLADDPAFRFYHEMKESVHRYQFKHATLKDLLDFFHFRDEVDNIKEIEKSYYRLVPGVEKPDEYEQVTGMKYHDQLAVLDDTFEKYQSQLETHMKEEIMTFLKGQIYFSKMAMLMGKTPNPDSFEFCTVEEIHNAMKSISFKGLVALMFTSEDPRLEGASLVNFIIRYAHLNYEYLVDEYFDFALEEFPIFEKRSFLERLNKIKKYEDIIRKVIRFVIFLPDHCRAKFSSIAINYIRYNKAEPLRKALFLGLGFILLWENQKQEKYKKIALKLACELIEVTLAERIPKVRTAEISDLFDPLCVMLFLFGWNSVLIKKITESLDTQGKQHVWMQIYKNLDYEWGSVLLQKSFRLGNLASLERELQDNPVNIGYLLYFKAKDYFQKVLSHINTNLGSPVAKALSFHKKLEMTKENFGNLEEEEKRNLKEHLRVIIRQLIHAYRYLIHTKKDIFAQKLMRITKAIFEILES